MGERIDVLIPEETLTTRIKEVAEQISRDYDGKRLCLICILKGSIFFTCELSKRITGPVMFDFMQVKSYGDATVSSGNVVITKDLDDSIEGKDVLLVEDILDSGRTLSRLIEVLKERNPASLKVCTMLDKPSRREFHVDVEYNCFEIEDKFVVGFGLDYAQKYRNLPFIGVLEFVD